jgi:hypothetical protein
VHLHLVKIDIVLYLISWMVFFHCNFNI